MFAMDEILDSMDTQLPVFNTTLQAPFPYFGGKSVVASIIWEAIGDVKTYIEPFFGSGAVLLRRPQTHHDKIYEIANDKDCFVVNTWRAIKASPNDVARYAFRPVYHVDMHIIRNKLAQAQEQLARDCQSDLEYYDAEIAGYWIWLNSVWIGADVVPNKVKPTLCKRPHLPSDMGITRTILDRTGDAEALTYAWLQDLADRLRCVKVVCSSWDSVCEGTWQSKRGVCGVFLDPPYASNRDKNIYRLDDLTIGKQVEQWCLRRGQERNLRIVVAGYDDEYTSLVADGWKVFRWKAQGGYSSLGKAQTQGKINRHRECLFFSPNCLFSEQKGLL